MGRNQLFFGDNLEFLRQDQYFPDESIDLVYLDPPFNSKADYNVLFKEQDGSRASAQLMAFEDTWDWNAVTAAAYFEFVQSSRAPEMARRTLVALHDLLGGHGNYGNSMLAYLSMMAPRLLELHRVLKATGSIYLHCDPTASHYLKLMMDSIFDPSNFRNEVIWKRTGAHNGAMKYGPVHDTILFYTKSKNYIWNQQFTPLSEKTKDEWFNNIEAETGRRFNRDPLTAPGTRKGESGLPWRGIDVASRGRHWAIPLMARSLIGDESGTMEALEALDSIGRIHWPTKEDGMPMFIKYIEDSKGVPAQDIITDIPPLKNNVPERLGYPTQKPEALIERFIVASSNEDSLILDPFCGCGTAVAAAQRLGRRWIGIDITYLAIDLIKRRLGDHYGKGIVKTYQVIGEPVDFAGAEALATEEDGRYQFQYWVLSKLDARLISVDKKKGADKGVDGRIYFHDDKETGETKKVICSVKSGDNIKVGDIRDLRGAMERDKAAIGVFVSLREPTRPMREEAIAAGVYRSPWGTAHPRLQLITVSEILNGKVIDMPPSQDQRTFKKAPKAKKKDRADYSLQTLGGLFAGVPEADAVEDDVSPPH